MTSRRQIALYLSSQLSNKRRPALQSAAAWLVNHHQPRQADYLAAEIAEILAEQGYLSVKVITARPLSPANLAAVKRFLGHYGRQFEIETAVDPAVIGGIRIELPGSELDSTISQALRQLVEVASGE